MLSLTSGDVVLDIGCGTGLSLPLLRERVGEQGKVIGIELSPDMAAKARERVDRHGWDNVDVLNVPAEEAPIAEIADAVLFFLVHDVTRTPAAIEQAMSRLRGRGRVIAAGVKLPPLWLLPLIPFVWILGRRYVTTYEGIRAPWSHLARWLPDLRVSSALLGCAYFASGTRPRIS